MIFKFNALLFITFLFLVQPLRAQTEKDITTETLIWFRYDNKIKFNANWTLETEIEDRRFVRPDRQHQLVLPRVTLIRDLGGGWDTGVGFTYFLQSLPDGPEENISLIRPELRPHEELNYTHSLGTSKFKLAHRYRLEERFIHKTSGDELTDGYDFNFRFRYRIQLSYPLIKKESNTGTLTLKAYDELMLNFGKHIVNNTFDQNRLGIALNYGIRKQLQFQAEFLNWFQERSSGTKYYNRYITRFTLYHTIDLAKK